MYVAKAPPPRAPSRVIDSAAPKACPLPAIPRFRPVLRGLPSVTLRPFSHKGNSRLHSRHAGCSKRSTAARAPAYFWLKVEKHVA